MTLACRRRPPRIALGRDFGFYPIFITSRKHQQTSLGAGVLDGRAHERVDQLLQDDLSRYRFRDLDHCRKIEVRNGRLYRRRRIGGSLFGFDLRVELHELSSLRVGSPAPIARSGIPQVSSRNRLEAARRIKTSSSLVGDRLDVDKAVGVRRTHGFLIEVLSVEHPALNPGDLGTHERRTALEGYGVVLGPRLELLVVTD